MASARLAMVPVLVVLLPAATVAWGQADPGRFDRQLEQIRRETRLLAEPSIPPEQRAMVDYGGYFTFSVWSFDDFEDDTHAVRQYDLNGYGRLSLDGAHTFFLRGRTRFRDFEHDDRLFDGDEWLEPELDQGTYRFDLRRALEAYQGTTINGDVVIEGGRQLVHWANGLVLSQDIDGALVTLGRAPLELTVLAGLTRDTTIDFDVSRPDFREETRRAFYGAMLSVEVRPAFRPYVYGLAQDDYNDDRLTANFGAGPVTTRFDYNSYYIGGGAMGSIGDRLLYGVEAAYEGGDTLSNSLDPVTRGGIEQTRDPIEAWAADFRVDYLFTDANLSRLSGEVILASGDEDRLASNSTLGGNRAGTTDEGFNALGLLNTGLAFGPSVSNLAAVRAGASTNPFPSVPAFRRLRAGFDFFVFHKLQEDAPINEPTSDDSFLGVEPDVYITWEIASDVALAARYGVFVPGKAIEDSSARHFVYLGVTFSF